MIKKIPFKIEDGEITGEQFIHKLMLDKINEIIDALNPPEKKELSTFFSELSKERDEVYRKAGEEANKAQRDIVKPEDWVEEFKRKFCRKSAMTGEYQQDWFLEDFTIGKEIINFIRTELNKQNEKWSKVAQSEFERGMIEARREIV